jgi:hypothetical protein
MGSFDKDFVWELWKLFSENNGRLPLLKADTRCFRELVKWYGVRRRWIAPNGKDWMGLPQSDKSRDLEIQDLIEQTVKNDMKAKIEEGFDCTFVTRFFCSRKYANETEKQ